MATVSSLPATSRAPTGTAATVSGVTGQQQLAGNFSDFLTLLTTQLKNQNPLSPLDTNQFTQQLVQFAQVEQQINMNGSLSTMISLERSNQTTAALGFLGATVRVDGDTAKLSGGQATWGYTAAKPATASIVITNASGQTVYTDKRTVTAGSGSYTWNGRNANGAQLPDGDYKIAIVATDTAGQSVGVTTEVEGVVDGIDNATSPPVLSIGGQSFTIDKVRQIRRTAAGS